MDEETRVEDVAEEATPEETTTETAPEEKGPTMSDIMDTLNGLTKRLDGFEEWVNQAIGGIDKTQADEAEDTSVSDDGESSREEEVADIDNEFYERQRRYLEEGGY